MFSIFSASCWSSSRFFVISIRRSSAWGVMVIIHHIVVQSSISDETRNGTFAVDLTALPKKSESLPLNQLSHFPPDTH